MEIPAPQQKLSVVIITLNEEVYIGQCIDSVKTIADEVIVLDSFSTDKTVEIAASKGAIVKQDKFHGYIEQKNLALSFASHDLVLSLDADEMLDVELAAAILKEKSSLRFKAYTMNRCTNYCGSFIRHGHWYPDRKLRLFDKRIGRWGGMNPHDKIELTEAVRVMHLKGDILHYSYTSIEDHITQGNRFSTISANSLYKRGRKASLVNILGNPLWAFIHGYILRLGMLDGVPGLTISLISAHSTFLKYIKLYQLHRRAGNPS